ncbi:MAG TPA: DmsC/YnfH family molybdoenzyme membrane anchor subunit [Anaerolineaceae bacterium]
MEIQWMLVLYSLFMGLSIGPFALLALTDACEKRPALCKWASLVGLSCIILAGIAAFAHLLKPLAAINIFNNLASPMARETVFVLLTGVVAAALAVMNLFNWLPGLRRMLAWFGLVLAVISVILIATIYLLPARPAWNSWLLPITLLTSSLINGLLLAWLLVAIVPKQGDETGLMELAAKLRSWALPVFAVYAIVTVVFFLMAASQTGGITRLLVGDLALLFWLGLILVGLAAPAALIWLGKKDPKASALAAFLLVAIGGLVVRAMLFPIGVRIPITSLW